ncbi:MAG TPA: CBS domain-containing protein [Candidatus Lokiarchaeia archaeon]
MVEDRLDQFSKTKVTEVMIKNPIFTTPDEKISATELIMIKKNIGGLPVVDNQKSLRVIGIVTQRDIRLARFAVSLDSPYTTVKDLMTAEPYCVNKDDTINDVLDLMFEKKVERLPVVNNNN